MESSKIDIKSLYLEELVQKLGEMGEPKFRAKQIFKWLHEKRVTTFEDMTNLSVSLREKLDSSFYINSLEVERKLVSSIDGTIKYLYKLKDGNCIETVLMKYNYGNSLCVSTQVGCKMGCKFCASTLAGFVRNLTPSEILDEVYKTCEDIKLHVDSIVLMGIGEPMDNYENVLKFLRLISSPDGYGLSLRHVSLSSCGLVDKLYDLAKEKLGLTLTISLHATTNEKRDSIMPINKKWRIEELVACCKDYFKTTGRRVSFEYTLIKDKNDSPKDAKELAALLKGMPCHVNLIPVNPVTETGFSRGNKENIEIFKDTLTKLGVNATVRRELGADISAACGQLRREDTSKKEGN